MSAARLAIALFAAALCAAAAAQAPPPDCRERMDALDARRAALSAAQEEAGRESAALQQRTLALDAERASLETAKRSARVDAFNENVQQHKLRVDAHNVRIAAINADVEKLNADIEAVRQACGGPPRAAGGSGYRSVALGLITAAESDALDRSALGGRLARMVWAEPDRARREALASLAKGARLDANFTLPPALQASYLAAVDQALGSQQRLPVAAAGDGQVLAGLSLVASPGKPVVMEATIVVYPANAAGDGSAQTAVQAKLWYGVARRTLTFTAADHAALAANPEAQRAWQSLLRAVLERFMVAPS